MSAPTEAQPDARAIAALETGLYEAGLTDGASLPGPIVRELLRALAAAGLSITPTDRLACAHRQANVDGVLHRLDPYGLAVDGAQVYVARAVPVGEEPDQETEP